MSAIIFVKFFEGGVDSHKLANNPLEAMIFLRLFVVCIPVIVEIAPVCPREYQASILPDFIGSDRINQMW